MDPRRPTNSSSEPRPDTAASAEHRLARLTTLVEMAEDGGTRAPQVVTSHEQEERLIEARLGIASSLYTALRWKHEPTAQHCLRTALCCSGWAQMMGLPDELRSDLELSALLHDVGKVGVLDSILCKPAALNAQESAIMDCHWLMGEQILRAGGATEGVIDAQRYARGWFDGRRGNVDRSGDDLPLGARMLAVADAFDSMTTDQAYRRAMSVQRAFDELFRCAGTQFDPDLVAVFSKLFEKDPAAMQHAAAERWLTMLQPDLVQRSWRGAAGGKSTTLGVFSPEVLFQQKLVDNMHDAVIFLDANLKVLFWNQGAERLTGISGNSMAQRLFAPSVLQLCDESQQPISDLQCPAAMSVHNGVQWLRRLYVGGRGAKMVPVDAHALPVVDAAGMVVGLSLLLHDVSSEISLEKRCRNLHELATRDPLTQAANRAEFDRVLAEFIQAHRETKRPCSLIMTDIDRFKSINDTYGHQAGDQVIQAIALMLKNYCRPGDLVARYGGEEFALLCADCDNATAAARAEEVRIAFARVRHKSLGERNVTASFGVTEVQPGDTPETMLRRADRALFTAKETGRNRVVQLGVGGDAQEDELKVSASARKRLAGNMLLKREMVSDSPLERNIEKLEGFIADHHAEVLLADRNRVQIRIGGDRGGPLFKRTADRSIRLVVDLMLHEETLSGDGNGRSVFKRTRITAMISPLKSRDRRTADALDRARQLVVSLRSYLMASDVDGVEAVTEEAGTLWKSLWGLFGGGRTDEAVEAEV